jgi:hypothetical protein
MPITTKAVRAKPLHGEVYSIQHYVILLLPLLTNDTVLSNNREPSVNDFDLAGNRQAGQKRSNTLQNGAIYG